MADAQRFYQNGWEALSFTIADGASLSSAIDLKGKCAVAIQTPGTLAGTSMTFQSSQDNSAYANAYKDDGTEYSITISTSRFIMLDALKFAGCRWLKIRTGTAASPSAQTGAKVVAVIVRAL